MATNRGSAGKGPPRLLEDQRGLRQKQREIWLEKHKNEASCDESQEDTADHEEVWIGRQSEKKKPVQDHHEKETGASDIPQHPAASIRPNRTSHRVLHRYHLSAVQWYVRLPIGDQGYRNRRGGGVASIIRS